MGHVTPGAWALSRGGPSGCRQLGEGFAGKEPLSRTKDRWCPALTVSTATEDVLSMCLLVKRMWPGRRSRLSLCSHLGRDGAPHTRAP